MCLEEIPQLFVVASRLVRSCVRDRLAQIWQEKILTYMSTVHQARPDDETRLRDPNSASKSKSNLNLNVPAVAYQVPLCTGDSPSACRIREDINEVSNSLLFTALSLFGLRVMVHVLAKFLGIRWTIYALDETNDLDVRDINCVAYFIVIKDNL